jgi:hypothetical protein
MKHKALAVDMIDCGRTLVGLRKLAGLLNKPDLPRLGVIVSVR